MTIYIEIDGQPVDAREVCWITRSACGCISAVNFANGSRFTADHELLLTPHDVNRDAHDGIKKLMDRSDEDGDRHIAVTDDQWAQIHKAEFQGDCPHTPKWGRHIVVPEGYGWASADSHSSRRSYVSHLVPTGQITVLRDPERRVELGDNRFRYDVDFRRGAAALCGYRPTERGVLTDEVMDTVSCRKCEAAAALLPEAGAA